MAIPIIPIIQRGILWIGRSLLGRSALGAGRVAGGRVPRRGGGARGGDITGTPPPPIQPTPDPPEGIYILNLPFYRRLSNTSPLNAYGWRIHSENP